MAFRRILIALDDSALAAHAARVGMELTSALDAEPALVHVVDPTATYPPDCGIPAGEWVAAIRRDGQMLLSSTAARLTGARPSQFLREGRAPDEILAAAREWGADVIVIGTHGRSGVSRLVLGSTAESVIRHAACPVFVVKPAD